MSQSQLSVDIYKSYQKKIEDLSAVGITDLSRPKKSGITAIDMYYEGIDVVNEVEYLRYQNEFKRLVSKIHHHWKAKKFPMCE